MRITADVIDEEPCSSEEAARAERHLRIIVRDPTGSDSSDSLLDGMLRQFQNLSIRISSAASESRPDTPAQEEVEKQDKSMEEPKSDAPAQPSGDPSCCITYFVKMKEELKQEVIEEIMKRLDEKPAVPEGKKEASTSSAFEGGNKVVHTGILCDNCDQQIRGVRYKCGNCKDYDLCEECEKIPDIHDFSHIFLKLRYPFSSHVNVEPKGNMFPELPKLLTPSSVRDSELTRISVLKKLTSLEKELSTRALQFNSKIMQAKFVCDITVPDGSILPPGIKFVKSWKVCNTGTKAWNKDVTLHQWCGHQEMKPYISNIAVPLLDCGEVGVISVYYTAPDAPGSYESGWHFQYEGQAFGDILWCHIEVDSPHCSQAARDLSSAQNDSGWQKINTAKGLRFEQVQYLMRNRRKVKEEKRKRKECRKKEVKQIVDVLTAVQEDRGGRRSSAESLKPVVISHTTTPNNTPFDLTPPKSPEPRDFIVIKTGASVNIVPSSEEPQANVDNADLDYVTKASVGAVSSSESDSEFVVIPMPRCFSLVDSFTTGPHPSDKAVENAANIVDDQVQSQTRQARVTLKKFANSENVSQETGAPEEAENFNINAKIHVKEDCGKKIIISDVSMSCSPSSSSSVSIIESEDNVSPDESPKNTLVGPKRETPERLQQEEISIASSSTVIQQEEDNGEPPSSYTFPKFPLELDSPPKMNDVASAPTQEAERTIQVLPEGLVTGALIAAASVYNTARAVISSIQPGKNEQEERAEATLDRPTNSEQLAPIDQLVEMGFCDRSLNELLLKDKNGDVAAVVAELVNMSDSDWYASRNPSDSTSRD